MKVKDNEKGIKVFQPLVADIYPHVDGFAIVSPGFGCRVYCVFVALRSVR